MCLDVSKIDTKQAHEMNRCGLSYGMSGNDFFSFLTDDFEEQEALKLAREQEEEKAMFAVSELIIYQWHQIVVGNFFASVSEHWACGLMLHFI